MTVKINGENLPRRLEMKVAKKKKRRKKLKTNKCTKQKWLVIKTAKLNGTLPSTTTTKTMDTKL